MTVLGDCEISVLKEGLCRLDGGAMFGVVPKTLWSKLCPADERNRIRLGLNVLLVRRDDRTIIIDTGVGDKDGEKFRSIYGIELFEGGLAGALERSGINTSEVTDVIYTHLHFDHAGGGTVRLKDGSCTPLFPKATYHVQARHWEWAMKPSERDGASFISDNLDPLQASGRLNLIEGEHEIVQGITVIPGDNHTIAHQIVKIDCGDTVLLHCGDLIPMSSHVRPPYVMGYDLYPLGTLEHKKDVLAKAVDNDWILFFEHDPERPANRIVRTSRDFAAGERVEL